MSDTNKGHFATVKSGEAVPRKHPVVVCCYVHDSDAENFKSAFGLGEPRGKKVDWFLWQDKNLIGPERAFQHCWSLFPDRDIIILHPDMLPLPADRTNLWYDNLLRYADQLPEAGILACDLLFRDQIEKGSHAVQSGGGVFVDGVINYIGGRDWPYDDRFRTPRMVQWATFGGVYLRRDAIDACGGFDSRYVWAYVMDVDYSLEVRRRGFTIYNVPVNLIHDENGTTKDFLNQPSYQEKITRNHRIFREKWKNSPLLLMSPQFELVHELFKTAPQSGSQTALGETYPAAQTGDLVQTVARLKHEIAAVKSSWSWRLTKPLRLADGALRSVCSSGQAIKARVQAAIERRRIRSTRFAYARAQVPLFEKTLSLDAVSDDVSQDWSLLDFPKARRRLAKVTLTSCLCTRAQMESEAFRYWIQACRMPWTLCRKFWEFAFIAQALYERGCLREGKKGLGFAVGEEPLPALFASMGSRITATDLDPQDTRAKPWADTAQLACSMEKLLKPDICDAETFKRRVEYRHVDMNRIPADLRDYDFIWSSCSFEHCGSIQLGLEFVMRQMDCLKPGGIAVHTTEFNLNSNDETVTEGLFVIFRKKDIESLVQQLEQRGHRVEKIRYSLGKTKEDRYVDVFPYSKAPHLKLLLADRFVSTSISLIIQKGRS